MKTVKVLHSTCIYLYYTQTHIDLNLYTVEAIYYVKNEDEKNGRNKRNQKRFCVFLCANRTILVNDRPMQSSPSKEKKNHNNKDTKY